MKKINDWVIKTFGLRGSWSWAKKQMLNGAIIKRKATTGTYKIAIDNDKNRLLVATWGHYLRLELRRYRGRAWFRAAGDSSRGSWGMA